MYEKALFTVRKWLQTFIFELAHFGCFYLAVTLANHPTIEPFMAKFYRLHTVDHGAMSLNLACLGHPLLNSP